MSGPDSVRVLERCDLCAPCVFVLRSALYATRSSEYFVAYQGLSTLRSSNDLIFSGPS